MKMFDVYPLYDIDIVRAEGSYMWNDRGEQYLDMYGGHAVISIGHTHPHYVERVEHQIRNIGFYSNSVINDQQGELARKLGRLTGKEAYQLFLCNSGAEANENALKLASFHNGRRKIVAMHGSFHGRTSLAVAATDNPAIVAPVNETDNVIFTALNDVEALREIFKKHEVCAVIIEGIQGVGGIREASVEFLRAIRTLCDEHGAVYIADAVQCGCGRTGIYYSHDWAGVEADIYTMAKGLANGFPIGAIAASPKFTPRFGMLGTTFGGNHLACAAAIAVADVMLADNLMANAAELGDYLIGELRRMPGVKEVRGRGLMIGVEMPYDTAELRKKMVCGERTMIASSSDKNTFRILPALNITREHADKFLASLRKVLTA